SLDRRDDLLRMLGQLFQHRLAADDRRAAGIGDDRGHQPVALLVAQDLRLTVGGDRRHGIGGAEIDTDRDTALFLMRRRRLARLVDLQQGDHPGSSIATRRARVSSRYLRRYLNRVASLSARSRSSAAKARDNCAMRSIAWAPASTCSFSTASTLSASANCS